MLNRSNAARRGIETTDIMVSHVQSASPDVFSVPVKKQPVSLRILDVVVASIGLVLSLPVIAVACLFIWLEDRDNPFYIATRIGAGGKPFKFIKLRSISRKSGVRPDEIISASDTRVTRLGHFIRATKLDELPQFLHVLRGEMSLVGPRANVPAIVASFTPEEMRIISVKPGITDLASIVFLKMGSMLRDSTDPKGDYERLVRPWKSRLALLYVDRQSFGLACKVLWLTVLAFLNHDRALKGVAKIAETHRVHPKLAPIVRREQELVPFPPPGADQILHPANRPLMELERERIPLSA